MNKRHTNPLKLNYMMSFDIYQALADIKDEQKKIYALFKEHAEENFTEKYHRLEKLEGILGISKRTVQTWKKNGFFQYSQIGGITWISESQLKAFLEKFSTDSLLTQKVIKTERRAK
jgi:hypothetical protein